jgi:hypothetical protein
MINLVTMMCIAKRQIDKCAAHAPPHQHNQKSSISTLLEAPAYGNFHSTRVSAAATASPACSSRFCIHLSITRWHSKYFIYSSPFEERLLRFSCQPRGSHNFPSPPKGDAREIEEIQYLSAECFSNSPKEKKTSPWLMQIKKANSISLFIYLMHPLSALCSAPRARRLFKNVSVCIINLLTSREPVIFLPYYRVERARMHRKKNPSNSLILCTLS